MSESTNNKKRKHREIEKNTDGSTLKKVKKNKERKRDEKGKGRAEDSNADSAFRVVSASVTLTIPPIFGKDLMKGVHEMLDSLVMRYIPALRGVVLGHANATFLAQTARVKGECPFAICPVAFDATVWSPQVGAKLTGTIKLCSPDHIALLVLQTFNVSIPRNHIETENWEFQYGPAENDPEYGPTTTSKEEDGIDEGMAIDVDQHEGEEATDVGGSWLHKLTSEKLGGSNGILDFTVIGLKVANQMLSLVGSLQVDPFSERHVLQPAVLASLEPENVDTPEILEPSDDYDDEDEFPETIAQSVSKSDVPREESGKKDEKKRRKEEKKREKELKEKEKELKAKEKEQRRAAKEERRKEKEERRKEKESKKSKSRKDSALKKVETEEKGQRPLIGGKVEG